LEEGEMTIADLP
jgi:hypothetical protein